MFNFVTVAQATSYIMFSSPACTPAQAWTRADGGNRFGFGYCTVVGSLSVCELLNTRLVETRRRFLLFLASFLGEAVVEENDALFFRFRDLDNSWHIDLSFSRCSLAQSWTSKQTAKCETLVPMLGEVS